MAPLGRNNSIDDTAAAVAGVKASLHGIDRLLDKKPTEKTMKLLAELEMFSKKTMAAINIEEGLSPLDVVAANVARGHKKIEQHSKLMLQPRSKKRKLERN